MEETRRNFKQNTSKYKIEFMGDSIEAIKREHYNQEDSNMLLDIVDYYYSQDCNFLTLKRIFLNIIKNKEIVEEHKDQEALIAFINEQLSTSSGESEHSSEYHDNDQLLKVAKEFQQIEDQTQQMLGKSINVVNDVSIIKIDEENNIEYLDNIDLTEMIDLGEEMEADLFLSTNDDLEQSTQKYSCVFCNQRNIIILSSTEGYCLKCAKSFLISREGNK